MNRKIKYIFLSLIFSFSLNLNAKTIVYGIAPSYKNDVIQFYKYSDLISLTEKEFFTLKVDSNGKFEKELDITEITYAFFYTGVFKCIVYFEPNKNIWLNFPKKTEKTLAENLNPFFKETDFFIGINDTIINDLNFAIKKFDDIFDDLLANNFFKFYRNAYKINLDSIIDNIDNDFSNSSNEYFNEYRKYKYYYLKNIVSEREISFVCKEYLKNKEILYNNTSYMFFFNQLFTNFFSVQSKSAFGNELANNIILEKSPKAIKSTLNKNIAFQDNNLQELIILKSINDAYYFKSKGDYIEFPKKQLFQLLDSIKITSKNQYHKEIATNLKYKFDKLKIGTAAPEFELHNSDDKLISLNSFNNKFIYINFFHIKSISSLEELKLIENLYKNHKKDIHFISIVIDSDFYEAQKYFEEKNFDWTLLDGNIDKKIKTNYNIKGFPTYYFLSDEKKFLLSPAPSPTENFETIFLQKFKSRKFRTKQDYDELIYDPTKK